MLNVPPNSKMRDLTVIAVNEGTPSPPKKPRVQSIDPTHTFSDFSNEDTMDPDERKQVIQSYLDIGLSIFNNFKETKPLPGMEDYLHFDESSSSPSNLIVQEDDEEMEMTLNPMDMLDMNLVEGDPITNDEHDTPPTTVEIEESEEGESLVSSDHSLYNLYHNQEGKQVYRCKLCNKGFNYAGGVETHHYQIHEQLKRFVCKQCDKRFISEYTLKKHQRIVHTDEMKRQCLLCEKIFTCPENLKNHIKTIHQGIKKEKKNSVKVPINGDEPEFLLSTDNPYYNFYRVGESGRLYRCKICNKGFNYGTGVETHYYRYHEKVKRFNCNDCGKLFNSKETLKKHNKLVHGSEDVKKIKCEFCDETFAGQPDLTEHAKRIHENIDDEESVSCEFCEETLLKSRLNSHLSSVHHVEIEMCAHCDLEFDSPEKLKLHIRKEHIDIDNSISTSYNCGICDQVFDTDEELNDHLQTNHKKIIK